MSSIRHTRLLHVVVTCPCHPIVIRGHHPSIASTGYTWTSSVHIIHSIYQVFTQPYRLLAIPGCHSSLSSIWHNLGRYISVLPVSVIRWSLLAVTRPYHPYDISGRCICHPLNTFTSHPYLSSSGHTWLSSIRHTWPLHVAVTRPCHPLDTPVRHPPGVRPPTKVSSGWELREHREYPPLRSSARRTKSYLCTGPDEYFPTVLGLRPASYNFFSLNEMYYFILPWLNNLAKPTLTYHS